MQYMEYMYPLQKKGMYSQLNTWEETMKKKKLGYRLD
jgi:hypothetical protein